MPDIYVVNLAHSTKRRAEISAQLAQYHLPFTIFSAVNGQDQPTHPLFAHYSEQKSIATRARALSLGQLGCFASHYLLWQECITQQRNIIVLEDDAVIDGDAMATFYRHCDDLPAPLNFIRLHRHRRKSYKATQAYQQDGITIARFNKGHMGTIGYFLSPQGAQKLLDHAQKWYLPVDIYMDQFWLHQVDSYGLIPACVTHNDNVNSEIGYANKKRTYSWLQRCQRELYNAQNHWARCLYNLKYALSNK